MPTASLLDRTYYKEVEFRQVTCPNDVSNSADPGFRIGGGGDLMTFTVTSL